MRSEDKQEKKTGRGKQAPVENTAGGPGPDSPGRPAPGQPAREGAPEEAPGAQAESAAGAAESAAGAAESAAGAESTAGAGSPAGAESPESAAAPPVEDEQALLARELDEAKQLAGENYEKYLRFQAEFENYKKRIQKEQAEAGKYATLPLLRDLIGILDNLERAMEHARNAPDEGVDSILAGVEMVAKQLNETFDRYGMTRIASVGEPFDPTRHEAMGVVETEEGPEDHVVEEFQSGYLLHDRVVKPAMVMVSKKGQASAQTEPAADSAEPVAKTAGKGGQQD